jgi:hypothetical protein
MHSTSILALCAFVFHFTNCKGSINLSIPCLKAHWLWISSFLFQEVINSVKVAKEVVTRCSDRWLRNSTKGTVYIFPSTFPAKLFESSFLVALSNFHMTALGPLEFSTMVTYTLVVFSSTMYTVTFCSVFKVARLHFKVARSTSENYRCDRCGLYHALLSL